MGRILPQYGGRIGAQDKVFVRGPDAAAVLDHLTTRDMNRIAPGRAAYLSVLTDDGTLADDAIVSNNGGDEWMIVHGSGDTMALLEASANGKNASIEFTDDLHDISVQGPKALDILNAHCSIDLPAMKYFHHAEAELFGHPCRISRTGYSGERGYEVFTSAAHAVDIWDKLADAGVMPCSFTALDKVRIEAGLLFYGYDMTTDNTPGGSGPWLYCQSEQGGLPGQGGADGSRSLAQGAQCRPGHRP